MGGMSVVVGGMVTTVPGVCGGAVGGWVGGGDVVVGAAVVDGGRVDVVVEVDDVVVVRSGSSSPPPSSPTKASTTSASPHTTMIATIAATMRRRRNRPGSSGTGRGGGVPTGGTICVRSTDGTASVGAASDVAPAPAAVGSSTISAVTGPLSTTVPHVGHSVTPGPSGVPQLMQRGDRVATTPPASAGQPPRGRGLDRR